MSTILTLFQTVLRRLTPAEVDQNFINLRTTADAAAAAAAAIAALTNKADFTVTATGMTTAPTGTASFVKNDDQVTMIIPTISGVSNATTFTLTGMPTTCRPGVTRYVMVRTSDNGGPTAFALATISSSGVISLYAPGGSGTPFTAAGTKGVYLFTFSYII